MRKDHRRLPGGGDTRQGAYSLEERGFRKERPKPGLSRDRETSTPQGLRELAQAWGVACRHPRGSWERQQAERPGQAGAGAQAPIPDKPDAGPP